MKCKLSKFPKFKEVNNINFPLLSDFNKEAITAYDVRNESFGAGFKGVAKRASFVIDKDGIVRFAEVLPNPGDYPNFDAIKKTLEPLSRDQRQTHSQKNSG